MVEIDNGAIAPQMLPQFIPSDHFAGMLKQHHQYAEGLPLKADADASFGQITGLKIELENAKTEFSRTPADCIHNRKRVYHSLYFVVDATRIQIIAINNFFYLSYLSVV